MASRLYRTTRQRYLAVKAALRRLHLPTLGTPTLAVLIAWTVTGLILTRHAANASTRGVRPARTPTRCAQPPAADDALVAPGPDGPADGLRDAAETCRVSDPR
jgi:hypothetical protein